MAIDLLRLKSRPLIVLASVALLGTAAAAITIAYTSPSEASLGAKSAPVVYDKGTDAAVSDYVPTFQLSQNRTSFAVQLRGVPEGIVTVDDLFRVRNVDTRPHTITIATTQVANPLVVQYRVDFMDGARLAGTLDLKAANPQVTFADLPAGAVLVGKTTIVLAPGAGNNNLGDVRAITLAVSP